MRLTMLAVLVALFSGGIWTPPASAQETTGSIEVYAKDKSGAAISTARAEVTGAALLNPRSAQTDAAGYVQFAKLPPGEYSLEVKAPNFQSYKVEAIQLLVGKRETFAVELEVGTVVTTIEVTAEPTKIDVTSSKAAVAIPQDIVDNLPKGRSFQSLIAFAPGARQEPLQSSRVDRFRSNGFQIDGASDSENTYLIEGLDTTNISDGGVKQNVIFEFIQELQVKTSGYEAEYGGALGGVVNVVQKRGGAQFHGGLVTYYRSSGLDANDQCAFTPQTAVAETVIPSSQQSRCGLRADPSTSINQGGAPRLDQAAQYYRQKQDSYYTVEPGYQLGGPILKDRLWFFSSYVPSLNKISRAVNFTGATNPGPRTFVRTETTQNALNRLDYQPIQKVHVFGAWQYGYSRITGQLPTFPDSDTGQTNTIATNDPATFRSDTGSVNPSNLFDFGGDWTINSQTIVSARYGYFYYNSSDRGKPAGIRDVFMQDLTVGGTTGLNGLPLIPNGGNANAGFAHLTGFANIANNQATIFDMSSRKSFATDVSYFLSKWGTHNIKLGYGFNHLSNNVLNAFNSSEVDFYWGAAYTPRGPAGTQSCATIIGQNPSLFGISQSQANALGCRGNSGYFIVKDGLTTAGEAASYNHSLFLQDSWTVGHGLTVNVGVRFDKEFVPPYRPDFPSFSFGFGDKVAPRIGGAYDLFHDGKLKVFASYGKFFDIMKYSLARTYFGGQYWHECVYALDFLDFSTVTPTSPGGHSCGPDTGPSAGVTVGRFIENFDRRATSPASSVDPNMKPMSQHEYVVGADWAIDANLGLEVRYARKRLDNAIEDFSIADGTDFFGNPGPNSFFNLLQRPTDLPIQCAACPLQPKAIRRYDGLESRLTYRRGGKFYGQLAYTHSRLRGNYSGLTNSDITDGSGGRHSPNNSRMFDLPVLQFTTTGAVVDGPLATDRPHVLTLTSYYRLRWLGMETAIGGNQLVASGTPKSTCIPVMSDASTCQFWGQRGTFVSMHRDPTNGNIVVDSVENGARMPMFSQTDFNVSHSFGVSKTNEAMKLGVELNVLNLFNQGTALAIMPTPFRANTTVRANCSSCNSLGIDFLTMMTGWNPITAANAQGFGVVSPLTLNSWYGLPDLFQNRRSMRLALRFSF